MDTLENLKKIAVVGAGGKMGSGISLLVLIKLAFQKNGNASLHLIDRSESALARLKHYLKEHLKKESEKRIILLREMYQGRKDLIENADIVQYHLDKAMERVYFSIAVEEVCGSDLIFEAVFEKIDLKLEILKKIATLSENGVVLSNTSSIPIGFLEKNAGIKNRIAGFHFYNPPLVQQLVEVVVPKEAEKKLLPFCLKLAKELGKTPVVSNDTAGFIGNGMFAREILLTMKLYEELRKEMPAHLAVLVLNGVTKDLLMRPMGIFQLIDYVGVDVALNILSSMARFLEDPSMKAPLLEEMAEKGRTGGHSGDSGQNEGFFRYKGHDAEAVYDAVNDGYRPLDSALKGQAESLIGEKSDPSLSWKALSKALDKDAKIEERILSILKNETLGSKLLMSYLRFLRDGAELLVRGGVAQSTEDVSKVLKLGFYHLYGPDARFLTLMESTSCKGCCP